MASACKVLINFWTSGLFDADSESTSLTKLKHLRLTQHFFLFPGPPYFGLSRHIEHDRQSSAVHPVHVPQRPRFLPVCQAYKYMK